MMLSLIEHRWHVECSLVLAAAAALGCRAGVSFEFEQASELSAWQVNAPQGSLELETTPDRVKSGHGSLKFSYNASSGGYYYVEARGLQLQGARSLRFDVWVHDTTPLRLVLTEKDYSQYDAYGYLPAEQWVHVELALGDFQLAEGSRDENSKLDLDQVESCLLSDLSNLGVASTSFYGRKQGAQELRLDNFHLDEKEVPSRARRAQGATTVANLAGELLCWLPLGGANLHVPPAAPEKSRPLVVEYQFGGRRWQGAVTSLGFCRPETWQAVLLEWRDQSAGLQVVLQEYDGTKYVARLDAEQTAGRHEVSVKLSDFRLAPGSYDENGQLDADQIRVLILLVDVLDSLLDAQGRGHWVLDRVVLR